MYLKHLTISGFKSFAKKGELEFSAPITSIVGPNGSGKSNVAESFRFVLGEQSVKGMRAKKGADLIFNGSDSTSRGNRASVSITLDNTKRVFPMDFDEIILERTVHRDGQNEYHINSSKVRLKDVQELLSAANIGPTGHHIISQGEADRILSASPKERREMIEDALGLKVFQYKKVDAEKKLKKTRENIERVQSLRREVAPHLKFLERQVKKIERAVLLREELTRVYSEYLKREDTYIAHHSDRLRGEREEPAKKLEELKEQLVEAKKVLADSEDDEKGNGVVELEEKISAVRTQRQALLRQSGQLEGQVSFLKRRIEQAHDKSTQKSEAPIPMSEMKKILQVVESSVEKAVKSDDVSALQRALSDVMHTLKKFVQGASGVVVVNTDTEEKELVAIEKELHSSEKEITAVEKEEAKLTEQYDELKRSIESESQESREAEREVFRVVGEQRDCENTIARIDGELGVLERDRNEFKRELQEAVSLIGSGASRYFSFEIVLDGKVVSNKVIAEESRELQRERRRSLEKMKIRLEELGGANSDIEKEYKEVKERDDFLVHEVADLEASVEKLEKLITELALQLNEQFVAGIDKIGAEFNRFFALMFGGGEAKLLRVKPKVRKKKSDDDLEEDAVAEEEDEDEVVEEGVDLDVKLPNKRVRGLDMLSGGERALTSIALIFAMSQINPPLFIILDETDAALDEANSRRYGDMIQALAEKSQLILITHNRETMSRAGILYGVTMGGDGVSKLLSVKFDEAVAVAK
ncbi:MAG: chromosome segregation ATPase [Patiriisocius sp.]|jgi:chromosome segregation ATPase